MYYVLFIMYYLLLLLFSSLKSKQKLLFNDTLTTIWSAPNYNYRCGNVAAICEIDSELNLFYNTFDSAPESRKSSSSYLDPSGSVPENESLDSSSADLPEYFL